MSSFTHCLSYSLIRKRFDYLTRSKCEHCKQNLFFWQLFPLLSYLFLKGRCYFCNIPISSDHFYIELYGGLCSLLLFSYSSLSSFSLAMYMIFMIMVSMDFLGRWVPDLLQIAFLLLGLLYNSQLEIISLQTFLIFCLFTFLVLLTEQAWLGGADLKFICISLLYIPFSFFPLYLFLASLFALFYAFISKDKIIPFIPYLIFSFILIYTCT
ncbi:prepilin peptidase [Facklamia miroungae]